jgi:membrane protein
VEQYLALGSSATAEQIMGFIQNVNAATLGSVGGAFLFMTVISTLGTIERAFNVIFHVPESRSYFRKFTDYISVLVTVPLFMVAGLAATAWFSFKLIAPLLAVLTPFMFAWAGFFFLFIFFPYRPVSWKAALVGAAITAICFQIAQYGYVHFQVGVARYRAIYGALATVPVLLVWIYTAWIIVLFGAELTASIQRGVPAFILKSRTPDFARATALYLMLKLAQQLKQPDEQVSYESIALEVHAQVDDVEPIIDRLKERGLILEDLQDKEATRRRIFLRSDPSIITIDQIVDAAVPEEEAEITDPRIRHVLTTIHAAALNAVKPLTLADLIGQDSAAPQAAHAS